MIERNRVLTRGAGWGLLLVLLAVPACGLSDVGEVCLTYACINGAVLSGTVQAPAETRQLRVKYCSEQACVEGPVDIESLTTAEACIADGPGSWGDSVCFKRSADGALEVRAQLTRLDDGTLPADGERYTLEIVDEDSGAVLLDEAREADYVTTRRDNCHWCWSAEMSL